MQPGEVMTDGSDDHQLAFDIIDVHGRGVAARRAGECSRRGDWRPSRTGKVVDPGARDHPTQEAHKSIGRPFSGDFGQK
jgi:hypothetical protein